MFRIVLTFSFLLLLLCGAASAQQAKPTPAAKNSGGPSTSDNAMAPSSALRASAAYAEVILRKTELQADLESLEAEFTDEYPKVKEARIALTLIETEVARLTTVKPADAGKLTAGLGKLIVRKVELETALTALRTQYDDKHPDVISAKKKVDTFEKAIGDILR